MHAEAEAKQRGIQSNGGALHDQAAEVDLSGELPLVGGGNALDEAGGGGPVDSQPRAAGEEEAAMDSDPPTIDLSAEEDLYSAAIGAGVGMIQGKTPILYLLFLVCVNFVVQLALVGFTGSYIVLPQMEQRIPKRTL